MAGPRSGARFPPGAPWSAGHDADDEDDADEDDDEDAEEEESRHGGLLSGFVLLMMNE